MNRTPFLILLAVFALPFCAVSDASARETNKISYRASKASKVGKKLFAKPRRQLPPAKRVFLGTNVYKYQGRATVRHDEVSSPEIIFHIRNGRLVPGHSFDR